MGAFKKYDGSTWQSINPKQLKGVPYTGTLPAVLTGTKAGYLHRYKIYGNTEQTGTPTPENPIVPSECGERTENLFDGEFDTTNGYLDAQGQITSSAGYQTSNYVEVEQITQYSLSMLSRYTSGGWIIRVATYDANHDFISLVTDITATGSGKKTATFSTDSNTKYVRFSHIASRYVSETMLTEGSTAPTSYIPYGYKLPLLSGSTPVDIYLGDEPLRKIGDYADYIDYGTGKIVRQVGKIEWTGSEYVAAPSNYKHHFYQILSNVLTTSGIITLSLTHYQPRNNATLTNLLSYPDGTACFRIVNNQLWYNDSRYTTATEFKSFLADQYTAGTPVTIWYVLATPVEEDPPVLFPQIPTSANSTTISWGGQGLAPSQFDSIQEWVDIPTYTYTNGEWVADNSN